MVDKWENVPRVVFCKTSREYLHLIADTNIYLE